MKDLILITAYCPDDYRENTLRSLVNSLQNYTDLFEKRHKGDYNDFYDFEEETVLRLFPVSKLFIARIEELLK